MARLVYCGLWMEAPEIFLILRAVNHSLGVESPTRFAGEMPRLEASPPKPSRAIHNENSFYGQPALAVGVVELAHVGDERIDGVLAHGVVERDAHAANGAVAGRADKIRGRGAFGEIFFDGFVAAGDAEDDVHQRARGFFDGAAVEVVAAFDGVIERFGFGFIALLNAGESAFGGDPFGDQAEDVDGERRRRVIERLFLDVRAVLQNGGQIFVGALGEILAHDDHGDAARAEIFLRAGEDQPEFGNFERARSDVRRHVRDERRGTRGNSMVLRAFDGVVGAQVSVGSIRGELDFIGAGNAGEFFGFGAGSDVMQETFFEFADGFGGPSAGVQNVNGLAGERKVLRHGRKLHAAATLDEDDGVVLRDGQELAKILLRRIVDGFKFRGAVRHFHDGHAGAAVIEQLLSDAFEYGKRQSRGSGVEINGALERGGSGAHVAKTFRWYLRCVRSGKAEDWTAL